MLQRFDPRCAAVDVEPGLTGLQARFAAGDFKIVTRFFLIGDRFAYARIDQPTLIDRPIEFDADGCGAGVDLGGTKVLAVVDVVASYRNLNLGNGRSKL